MRASAPVLCLSCLASPALAQVTFQDQATPAGVTTTSENSAHAAWGDYDGDGDQDLFLPINGGSFDPNDILYRNDGQGHFVDVAAAAGVLGHATLSFQHGAAWGDYDKDGRLDLFVASSFACELFHNEGDGTFTEVAAAAGVAQPSDGARGVAWGDVDGDGLLDLFVSHWNAPDHLYHNQGDGTFADVPGAGGCAGGNDASPSACFADYDGDGKLDVYVSRFGATNALYHNDGGLSFTDVTAAVGLLPDHSWGAGAFGDCDNDGDLDLYVPESSPPSTDSGRHYLNQGGTFVDQGTSSGLRFTHVSGLDPRGASWADFDADGDLDLFVTFNRTSAGSLPNPDRLFENQGNGTFLDVAPATGVDDGSQANGFAWADYDGNGFPDLYVVNEWSFPNNLFQSSGNGNHWVKIHLAGSASGTFGIGAAVRVRAGGVWQLREVSGGGTGFSCQDDLPVEVGLAGNPVIEEVQVTWPAGTVSSWLNLAPDREHVLVEGDRIGTNACGPAVPNSTGAPAEIAAYGSEAVADQTLTLQATGLPVGRFGIFIVGPSAGFTANPGGSQGNLCLDHPIARLLEHVRISSPAGEFHASIDISDLPQFGAVQAGETWHFQAWFRDENPAPTSNLTDRVSVTFH